MEEYKSQVEKLNVYPSDKKKLLSLPFYLKKREELPKPAPTETEKLALFEEIYGNNWFEFHGIEIDPEEKITEFNYENFLNMDMLDKEFVESPEFKR